MLTLKQLIKGILPYGIIHLRRKWINEHTVSPINQFMQDYRKFKRSGKTVQYDTESKFRFIVSVKGYGYTGSSAIVDLLREYSSIFVIGYVEPYYSKAISSKITDEIAYMRDAGGFAEIERFIGTTNRFQQDALLHRFILLVTRSPIYKGCPEVRPYFYQFFSDIAKVQEPTPDKRYYNRHLNYDGNKDIFSLRNLSLEQYRDLIKCLMTSIFNTFHSEGKEILVLDQFLLDCDDLYQDIKSLIPNIKTLVSIRDPREVYSYANKAHVMWIPHDTPEYFIEWYKDRNIVINNDSDIKKTIRFEHFFEKYDSIVSEIEGFLDIDESQHTSKYTCFDPQISIQGFMSWKDDESRKNDFTLIERELP